MPLLTIPYEAHPSYARQLLSPTCGRDAEYRRIKTGADFQKEERMQNAVFLLICPGSEGLGMMSGGSSPRMKKGKFKFRLLYVQSIE